MLILGDLMKHSGSLVDVWANEQQSKRRNDSSLNPNRSNRFQSHPMVIYPVSEWIKGINILRRWQKSHIDPPTWRVRAIVIKWKSLVIHLPRKMVNWKQYHIFRITAEISAIIKYLKDAGVLVPNTCPYITTIRPMKKIHVWLRMTVDCHTFSQEWPWFCCIPQAVSLLKQINTYFATWFVAVNLVNAFSLHLSIETNRISFIFS